MQANGSSAPTGPAAAILANALVLATVVYAAGLDAWGADLYYRSVQEDEYLEWGTFWAFLLASGVWLRTAARGRGARRRLPWFPLGLALFCLLVAMEEISWGQRLFAYRPPAYFLEHNYQQELNVHNVVDTHLRRWALYAVIAGYGLLLPLATLVPAARRLLDRLGVAAPPPALAPAFGATLAVYAAYPWKYSGEWVELMLGLGFLFAALAAPRAPRAAPASGPRPALAVALAWLAVMSLGLGNAAASRGLREGRPETLEAARAETEALRRDLTRRTPRSCGLHKRLYGFVEKYDRDDLLRGAFANLVEQGLPEQRADFFLDPWNSPYWIRVHCAKGRRRVLVYSFGPNRLRDSKPGWIEGDDVGVVVRELRVRRRAKARERPRGA